MRRQIDIFLSPLDKSQKNVWVAFLNFPAAIVKSFLTKGQFGDGSFLFGRTFS